MGYNTDPQQIHPIIESVKLYMSKQRAQPGIRVYDYTVPAQEQRPYQGLPEYETCWGRKVFGPRGCVEGCAVSGICISAKTEEYRDVWITVVSLRPDEGRIEAFADDQMRGRYEQRDKSVVDRLKAGYMTTFELGPVVDATVVGEQEKEYLQERDRWQLLWRMKPKYGKEFYSGQVGTWETSVYYIPTQSDLFQRFITWRVEKILEDILGDVKESLEYIPGGYARPQYRYKIPKLST